MKRVKIISMSLLIGLFLVLSANVDAQNAVRPVLPGMSMKVLLENEEVKVMEVGFAPGSKTEWHSHPNHVVYALTDGKIEITVKDKPVNVVDIKAGTAVYSPAVTHMVKNIGTTTVKMIVTELKPASEKMNAEPAPAEKK